MQSGPRRSAPPLADHDEAGWERAAPGAPNRSEPLATGSQVTLVGRVAHVELLEGTPGVLRAVESHDAARFAAHLLAFLSGQGDDCLQLLRQVLRVIRLEEIAVDALLDQVGQGQGVSENHRGGGAHCFQRDQGLQLCGAGLAEDVGHLVDLGQLIVGHETAENHAVGHSAVVRLLFEGLA